MIDGGATSMAKRLSIYLIGQLDAADMQPHFGRMMLFLDPDGAHYKASMCSAVLRILTKQPFHVVKDIPHLCERLQRLVSDEKIDIGRYRLDCAEKLLRDLRAQ